MSLEQNKAIVLQFYKVYEQGNLEQAKELIAANIVVDSLGSVIHGRDKFFEYMQSFRSTFPDIAFLSQVRYIFRTETLSALLKKFLDWDADEYRFFK